MSHTSRPSSRRIWLRLGAPIAVLLLGALVLAVLAWREGDRARRTAEVLMRDYASFVADKFVQASERRYSSLMNTRAAQPGERSTPLGLLQSSLRLDRPPEPSDPLFQYFFLFDAATRRLETAGRAPDEAEEAALLRTLEKIDLQCESRQVVSRGRIGTAGSHAGATSGAWSGWIQTDDAGKTEKVCGLRLDYDRAVDYFFQKLIAETRDCLCGESLLPPGLHDVADTRQAASFIIRDGEGRTRHASEPQYADASPVRRPLPQDMPFPGWTVEVSMNPAAVEPLLPYGGRGAPWLGLSLLAGLVLGAGGLALHSLRRDLELYRMRRDFVSNVSHELKTPLARIRLFNELLMDERAQPAQGRRYRGVIDRECRRLTQLVDNILSFARSENGAPGYRFSWFPLGPKMEEAVESYRAASNPGRLSLQSRIDDVGPVWGDETALQQALVNLLDNAIKYSPSGSRVEVTLEQDDDEAVLTVRDQGPGIPEGERERIFEPFYRLERGDAQKAAGSGLGLALVRRTAEAHAGSVSVDSAVDGGSAFRLRIPLAPDRIPAEAVPRPAEA